MDLNVIYEDNHIIVVYKEPQIPVVEDSSKDLDLFNMTKNYIKEKYNKPGNVFLGLVHRLDRVTSGVIVFAKTSKAASRLSEQIRKHKMDKRYIAVLEGKLSVKEDYLEDYLVKDTKKNKVFVTKDKNKGKLSKLSYKVVKSKDNLTLVDVDLITGRAHQIRVQFSSRGHSIFGDAKYNSKNPIKEYIALHAYYLKFEHPTKKEPMEFYVKAPEKEPWITMNVNEYIIRRGR